MLAPGSVRVTPMTPQHYTVQKEKAEMETTYFAPARLQPKYSSAKVVSTCFPLSSSKVWQHFQSLVPVRQWLITIKAFDNVLRTRSYLSGLVVNIGLQHDVTATILIYT